LNLESAILVGWSYAGFVIGDYLRRYGDAEIAGINFVSAAVGIGEQWFGKHIGPGFLDHVPGACSEDQAVALQTMRNFLHVAIKKPIPPEAFEIAMGWNMIVDYRVRAHLVSRTEDFTPELKKLRKAGPRQLWRRRHPSDPRDGESDRGIRVARAHVGVCQCGPCSVS
jgi:pimeloyl-ACP methyl ester carboxylesterase